MTGHILEFDLYVLEMVGRCQNHDVSTMAAEKYGGAGVAGKTYIYRPSSVLIKQVIIKIMITQCSTYALPA
jgi:hypothetical protein